MTHNCDNIITGMFYGDTDKIYFNIYLKKERMKNRQKDRETERQKDRKTERQKDRKTERQKDIKT